MPVDAKTRLVCYYERDENAVYPLPLDLKHCIYKIKKGRKFGFSNKAKSEGQA